MNVVTALFEFGKIDLGVVRDAVEVDRTDHKLGIFQKIG